MDGLKDRLLAIIQYLGLNKAEFEKLTGLSNGFVDKAGDNTRKSSLDRISNKFPEININWIRTGEGEMLKSGVSQNANGDNNTQVAGNGNNVNTSSTLDKAIDEIAEQRKLVAKSQEQIDRLLVIIEKMQAI